jgi:hypothetical protein
MGFETAPQFLTSALDGASYNAGCFKKSLTVIFQMLLYGECYEKHLHIKAYKLSIVQGNERHFYIFIVFLNSLLAIGITLDSIS